MLGREDRPYYFLQQLLIFLGSSLPAGEVLGAWIGRKLFSGTSEGARTELRNNFAFQSSWFFLRLIPLFISGLLYFYNSPGFEKVFSPESEISIPLEAARPEETPETPLERAEESRKNRENLVKRPLGPDEPIWPGQAGDLLILMSGGFTYLLLLFLNWALNLLNVIRVAMELPPFYPLTFTKPTKQKAGK